MRRAALLALLLLAGPATLGAQARQMSAAARAPALSDNPHGSLAVTCSACHLPSGWKPVRVSDAFRHAPETFPLEGAHSRTACTACHEALDFKGVSPRCASCHEDPHKGELGADCGRCHTPRSFAEAPDMKRAHELTRFPLRGAHAAAACTACHVPGAPGTMQFVNQATTCIACHAADAAAVEYPDHKAAGFTAECTTCHSIITWRGPRFDHAQTAFPLRGAHQGATCQGCHADKVYRGKDTRCVACHQADYDRTTTPRHADGFPTACTDCHGDVQWKGATFDHQVTRFPLDGAHSVTTCAGCHGDGVYRGKALECASCHTADFNRTTTPPHGAAGFATTCTTCHNTTAWRGAPFDHATTRFALTGAHLAVACTGCHADQVYKGRSMECGSCHQADFAATRNPPHGAAGFTAPCTACHTTTAWAGGVFNHDATRFPLTGGHRAASCAGCHADNVFRGRPTTCVSCHQADYDGTTAPPHRAGFPTACESCHGTTAWTGATFDHARTDFALTGAHLAVTCSGCHGDGVFDGKPSSCVSCHRARFDATTTPPHLAAGYATTCETCHGTSAWRGSGFTHTARFPLTGAHTGASCLQCHGDGTYAGRPADCASCHLAAYQGTTSPPHAAAGFPTSCATCHTTAAWAGAPFNHAATSFPLTGAHLAASCLTCHGDGVYDGKPTACVSCHQGDFTATTTPPHGSSGIGTNCTACHTTTAWQPGSYDHATTTFPLTGAHTAASCLDCHGDGVYSGKPATCVSCHLAGYQATTTPPHAAAGFPTTCATCHNTTAWLGTPFNHSTTAFPLTGAHLAVSCQLCHGDGVYDGKPTACLSCHQSDYSGTTRPPHGASGIGTTCTSCHTTAAWQPGTYDHSATAFPLTGAHTTATCAGCHGDGVYRGKTTACAGCHQGDYAGTTNPNHAAAGFPTACASCHNTATWLGATFNHDASYFPIYSGKHKGKWASCATCHPSPTDYKVFTCLTCHEHRQTAMDDKHRNRPGYSYTSQACLTCHPAGRK